MEKRRTPTLASQILIRGMICLGILLAGLIGMTSLASLKKPPAEVKVEERALRVETARVAAHEVGERILVAVTSGTGELTLIQDAAPAMRSTTEKNAMALPRVHHHPRPVYGASVDGVGAERDLSGGIIAQNR